MIDKFKRAIKAMLKDGEFDRILEQAPRRDRKSIRDLVYALEDAEAGGGIERVPFPLLLSAIQSVDIYRNIMCYMIVQEDERGQ